MSGPDSERRDGETLFLALCMSATVLGVPLLGYLLALGTACFVFMSLYKLSLLTRGVIAWAPFLIVMGVMRGLNSWEPRWWSILGTWIRTEAPALLRPATIAAGGTSLDGLSRRPVPDIEDMRDYAG